MSFEEEVIQYFHNKQIPYKANVKFKFANCKRIHEIDVIVPGYLIEVKENFHLNNRSLKQLYKFDDMLPDRIGLVLICRNAEKIKEFFDTVKFKHEFQVVSLPSQVPLKSYKHFYTHQNYLIEDIENDKNDFSDIYLPRKLYLITRILKGIENDMDINVIDENKPDYGNFYLIHCSKINNNLLKYILTQSEKNRLFFHFYISRKLLPTPHLHRPLIHIKGLTITSEKGIFFK